MKRILFMLLIGFVLFSCSDENEEPKYSAVTEDTVDFNKLKCENIDFVKDYKVNGKEVGVMVLTFDHKKVEVVIFSDAPLSDYYINNTKKSVIAKEILENSSMIIGALTLDEYPEIIKNYKWSIDNTSLRVNIDFQGKQRKYSGQINYTFPE